MIDIHPERAKGAMKEIGMSKVSDNSRYCSPLIETDNLSVFSRLSFPTSSAKSSIVPCNCTVQRVSVVRLYSLYTLKRVYTQSLILLLVVSLKIEDTPLAAMWAGVRTLRYADGPDETHIANLGKMELKRVEEVRARHERMIKKQEQLMKNQGVKSHL